MGRLAAILNFRLYDFPSILTYSLQFLAPLAEGQRGLCHGALSGVRPSVRPCVRPCVNFFFKHLLLLNYWANFVETSQE